MICVSLHRFGVGLGAIQSLGDIMEIVFGNKVKEETFKFIYLCIFLFNVWFLCYSFIWCLERTLLRVQILQSFLPVRGVDASFFARF